MNACSLAIYFGVMSVVIAVDVFPNITFERLETILGGNVKSSSRAARNSFVSFRPIKGNIDIGLDYMLPFIRVPMKRKIDRNGQDSEALVNINSAALLCVSFVAGGGLLVGYLLRSLGLQSVETESEENTTTDGHRIRRDEFTADHNFLDILEPFKLVYRNNSGARVETTLPRLLETVEDTFLQNNIDLGTCMLKSVCSLISKSSNKVRTGNASSVDKIIDGVFDFQWLHQMMLETMPGIIEAMDKGKMKRNPNFCKDQYSSCSWEEPERQMYELIQKYIHFT